MPNRVTTADRLAVMPAPIAAAATPGYNGPLTEISYEQVNGLQEAVCVPLEDGGVTLDKDNYTQFATLLSGVHGTISSIRTALATVATSTVSKQAASAVANAVCSGSYSQCNAGRDQTASGFQTQCNAGNLQVASSVCSQCNAGQFQTVSGQDSQCNAGVHQAVNGNFSQCNAGQFQTASGDNCQCSAGLYQCNSGTRASVIGGQYYELVDDNCIASGYGTSAPANHGDGLTNKNLSHYLNAQTGEARHKGTVNIGGNVDAGTGATIVLAGATGDITATGDLTVGGEIKGAGTDPLAIGSSVELLFEDTTASVDWATSAADHEAASPLVTYTDAPVVEITVTVANSDSGTHDIEMGSSLLLDINGLNSGFTRKLIGAVAETTAGSTNPQKGLRWSCGLIKNSAGVAKLAVTSVGKTTATIAASGADTVTVKVRLQYAKLTAI